MPDVLYVGLQDDDKMVASISTPAAAGSRPAARRRRPVRLSLRAEPGLARPICRLSRDAGHRELSHRLGQRCLDIAGARRDRACAHLLLATDRAGKYLLSAHYQGGYAAVHPLGSNGAVSGPALGRQNTARERTRS